MRRSYPNTRTGLIYKTPFQILVATILSAQCTDARVNEITSSLFRRYKSVYDFSKAKREILEKEIRSAGFYRSKTRSIIGSSRKIIQDFGAKVPNTMEGLVSLPGVARKTANIVLSSGFKKAEGIAVDTHVKRLSLRLGLSIKKDSEQIEQDLMQVVPKKDWIDFNYLFVEHGRKICKARKPLCPDCLIKRLCPSRVIYDKRGNAL